MLKWLFLILLATISAGQYIFQPGPLVPATTGQVWPLPQSVDNLDNAYYTLEPLLFQFKVVGTTCKILENAVDRYKNIILFNSRRIKEIYYTVKSCFNFTDPNFLGYLTKFEVKLTSQCNDNDYPSFGVKEEYKVTLSRNVQRLTSNTIWGILRGLETFSQLIYITADHSCLRLDTVAIHDYPRFPYRGLLLDTSRHYQPKDTILKLLDTMSWNKLNVFHWHVTDDNSFPYVSKTFPQLSQKGAFQPTIMVYQPDFVQEVIEYGRLRGIRVIVEFDTPGHSLSWGLGNPDLLTKCYNVPMLEWGPIDPTKNITFPFIFKLYDEIKRVFKDKYVHVGGDEVSFACWESNPAVNQWMADHGIAGDYAALQNYYMEKLVNYVTSLNLTSIVWEEVFSNGANLPKSSVVDVWISDTHNPSDTLVNVTGAGYHAIVSAYWYLDQIETTADWLNFYNADPLDFPGTDEQKSLVIGAKASMWTDVVDENNLEPKVWPRASAAAERFWSAPIAAPLNLSDIVSVVPVAGRIQEQSCRMVRRGIRAEPPSGSSVCF